MTPKLRALSLAVLVALPIDQLSKAWVAAHVPLGATAERIPLVEGLFYIGHVRNAGAAFGLLQDWPSAWRLAVFVVVAAIAVVVIVAFYRALAPRDRVDAAALGCILGGALGNLFDRFVHGEVIDFLHVRLWGDGAWPDFNLADVFIVVGVTTLILELLASEGAARAQRSVANGDDSAADD